jgi:hypothetical protein
MRTIFIIIISAVLAGAIWLFFRYKKNDEGPKQKPISVSKNSAPFNKSVSDMMNAYYDLTEAFVNWDLVAIPKNGSQLRQKLDSLVLNELRKDSTDIFETANSIVENARQDAAVIASDSNMLTKKHSLNSLSQNIYDFLRTVRYDQSKLFLQECPMAFNDTDPGVWLSKIESIRNPYLGLHHPHYGKGMISCGNIKDTLNFTSGK